MSISLIFFYARNLSAIEHPPKKKVGTVVHFTIQNTYSNTSICHSIHLFRLLWMFRKYRFIGRRTHRVFSSLHFLQIIIWNGISFDFFVCSPSQFEEETKNAHVYRVLENAMWPICLFRSRKMITNVAYIFTIDFRTETDVWIEWYDFRSSCSRVVYYIDSPHRDRK